MATGNLPEGWFEHHGAYSGRIFYYRADGRVTSQRPTNSSADVDGNIVVRATTHRPINEAQVVNTATSSVGSQITLSSIPSDFDTDSNVSTSASPQTPPMATGENARSPTRFEEYLQLQHHESAIAHAFNALNRIGAQLTTNPSVFTQEHLDDIQRCLKNSVGVEDPFHKESDLSMVQQCEMLAQTENTKLQGAREAMSGISHCLAKQLESDHYMRTAEAAVRVMRRLQSAASVTEGEMEAWLNLVN